MTRDVSDGQLVRIFLDEGDRLRGTPLFEEIVARARKMGLAGATVLRAIEGFGATTEMHTTRLLRLADELPIIVEVVDTMEHVEPFLDVVEGMIEDAGCSALVTLKPATVIRLSAATRR